MLSGIGASAGIGIGTVVMIKEQSLEFEARAVEDIHSELKRFEAAVERFCDQTMAMAEEMKARIGEKESEILMGQIMMISDPAMTDEIKGMIQGGQCAEASLEAVCNMFIDIFSAADDELTNQRATDVADLKTRMLKILLGIEDIDISAVPAGTVLVARDFTPSMTAGIQKEHVMGILTEVGGKTSHSAILARALEIPAVLSVPGIMSQLKDGDHVILDGSTGEVILSPDESQIYDYQEKRKAFQQERKALEKFRGLPTRTADGLTVELVGNIGKPEDAMKVAENDGEGIGLFRTEFLFMERTQTPSEEEQFEAYKKAALIMKSKPVIIRTLDIGGDKEIPYLGLEKEENPFLGFRAVRYCLKHPDLYRTQLRALLRASAFGDIRIMVPLVTGVEELREVKRLLDEAKQQLDDQNIDYRKDIQVGVMIETPAASLMADVLAAEADFFSIGTNDLTQYTMAVDRGNAKVAYLYSSYHPAVLRSIRHVIECGKRAGIMVGMCGEAASDPLLIPLLLSFGLTEFSVSPTAVLSVRKTISEWSREEAEEVAQRAMTYETEAETAAYLQFVRK